MTPSWPESAWDSTRHPSGVPLCERSVPGRASAQDAQPREPDHDQVDGHDDVEQPREHQDENAGNDGDDGLDMRDSDADHEMLPTVTVEVGGTNGAAGDGFRHFA